MQDDLPLLLGMAGVPSPPATRLLQLPPLPGLLSPELGIEGLLVPSPPRLAPSLPPGSAAQAAAAGPAHPTVQPRAGSEQQEQQRQQQLQAVIAAARVSGAALPGRTAQAPPAPHQAGTPAGQAPAPGGHDFDALITDLFGPCAGGQEGGHAWLAELLLPAVVARASAQQQQQQQVKQEQALPGAFPAGLPSAPQQQLQHRQEWSYQPPPPSSFVPSPGLPASSYGAAGAAAPAHAPLPAPFLQGDTPTPQPLLPAGQLRQLAGGHAPPPESLQQALQMIQWQQQQEQAAREQEQAQQQAQEQELLPLEEQVGGWRP